MTRIELHYNGVHTELTYHLLKHFGYSDQELAEVRIYCPLITLCSPDNTQTLLNFITQKETSLVLYQVLCDHGITAMHYTLQAFCTGMSDQVGMLHKELTEEHISSAWVNVLGEVVPELHKILITLEYR